MRQCFGRRTARCGGFFENLGFWYSCHTCGSSFSKKPEQGQISLVTDVNKESYAFHPSVEQGRNKAGTARSENVPTYPGVSGRNQELNCLQGVPEHRRFYPRWTLHFAVFWLRGRIRRRPMKSPVGPRPLEFRHGHLPHLSLFRSTSK